MYGGLVFGGLRNSTRDKWVGFKQGSWTVLDAPAKRTVSSGNLCVLCRCECGIERYVDVKSLSSGRSTSCGCRSKGTRTAKAAKN